MKESDWIEAKWSEKYQTCVSRLIPLVCEFDHCERKTNSLFDLGCVRVCRSCFFEAKKDNGKEFRTIILNSEDNQNE